MSCAFVHSRRSLYFPRYEYSLSEPGSAVNLPGFLTLKNYVRIEGSEDFNFSNTRDASFTIWREFAVLALKSCAKVAHF